MGESSYAELMIVALVGLVAVVAMIQITPSHAAADITTQSSVLGAAVSLPAYSQMDYDQDGRVSVKDSQILADAIALDACPTGKTCDLDSNRVLDERDLAILNDLLIEPKEEEPAPVVTGNVVASSRISVPVGYSSVTTTLA